MNIPLVFSLVFFAAASVYFFGGIYILFLNTRATVNRVFFILCLALFVWSFAFSIACSAADYETALLWRRISALGWGTIYSILLHFILVLTGKGKMVGKWWFSILLHLPAAVTVFVFSLYRDLAVGQYNLLQASSGWVNVSVNNLWDWGFNIYYIGFTVAGVILIRQWGRNSSDRDIKQQAHLLVISFAAAFLLGSMTDIILNSYMSTSVPQVGPVIILIPVSTIFYAIKRYGFMNPLDVNQTPETGEILSEATRMKVYQYLTLSFFFGSMLNMLSQYFIQQAPLNSVLHFSVSLFLIGIFIQLIQQLRIKEDYKDTVCILTVSASIPFIILPFFADAGTTVWAVPFIFVLLSVVFSKRRMIILLTVVLFLTQTAIWIKNPLAMVQVDSAHHLVRAGISGIAVWLAFYVNRIYMMRLAQNEDQIKSQRMVTQVSTDFVTANSINLEEKINRMLQLSGTYYQVDRAYLLLFSPEQLKTSYIYAWRNDGIEPATSVMESMCDGIPWWQEQMQRDGLLHIADVEMLPETSEYKKLLKKQGIRSLLSIPVSDKGKILGLLVYESEKTINSRRDDHLELLKILANLLADALAKVDAEQEINYMAYYDPLTALPNRMLLKNRLNQAIHLARRTERFIGVIFIDLDAFKAVNDTMGHEGGDELLQKVAEKLSARVRKYDTVARFGGDEFLIMLAHVPRMEDIRKSVEKIMDAFRQPVNVKGQEFFITASAGIAVYPEDGEEADTLIKNADLAMYSAKERGKNRYAFCSPTMKEEVMKKMQLTNSLYRAQERKELLLYYQPQVSLATKNIIGLEALLRWNHPHLGIITPDIFIPLAEQAGLINPIGEWVLRTACRQNKIWQEMGLPPLRMAVNLSVEQFKNPNLVDVVGNVLRETGLKPEYLELEITESTVIKEADYIIGVLSELKKLGVTIAIDDFGTEYSSLSRLKLLPVDRIKMAMQFVHGISSNTKDEAILKVIVHLAKNLQLKVIAEGVETDAQLDFLSREMCDEIQGYYFYKPMPVKGIEEILRHNE